MGFNSVYQTLKELFPQMDARILKAVAIEHSKDPDGAVEAFLTEVLPYISDQSRVSTSVAINNEKAVKTRFQSSTLLDSAIRQIITVSEPSDTDQNMTSTYLNEIHDGSVPSLLYDENESHDHLSGNSKNEELIALANFSDSLIGDDDGGKEVCDQVFENHDSEVCFTSHEDAGVDLLDNKIILSLSSSSNGVNHGEGDVSLSNGQSFHPGYLNDCPSYDMSTAPSDCQKEQCFVDFDSLEYQDDKEETLVSAKDHARCLLGAIDLNHPEPARDLHLFHGENQDASNYDDVEFIPESAITDALVSKNDTSSSTIVTRSGHICRISLLEDLIENAKTQKDDIFSAMESVDELIKEVEFQEKTAQQAKEDAARGGLEILERVEELKNMLKHAKEGNDMHAGEVYGERSILATEVKELQTRLLGLSDEKDRSLSILAEMRRTLEVRLAVAEEERRKAEQDISEKEETAKGALAEQELIMDKVVQESKQLQQQAEENAKLRDFLMEKGQVVDMLQGEISMICQDVKLLKESFENCASPGGVRSLSLKQTRTLLLPLNSSVKSVSSESDCGLPFLPSPARTLSQSSVSSAEDRDQNKSQHQPLKASEASPSKVKELSDDDWELFDI